MVSPLAGFRGIGRRFQTVGKAHGVEVIDDFAHNADKIAAAIRTAKLRAKRVLAIYQPHGYGPTRFLRQRFRRHLRPRARRRTTGCGCSKCSMPAAPRRATSPRPTSSAEIAAQGAQCRVRAVARVARRPHRRGSAGRRSGAGDGRARPLADRACAQRSSPRIESADGAGAGEVAQVGRDISCRTGR